MSSLHASRVPVKLIPCLAMGLCAALASCTSSINSGDHAATLEGTYWQLARLGDSPVKQLAPPQGPHIILESVSHRISGSGGCNRLVGSYQLAGHTISLGPMASTRMACMQGMETEDAFLAALTRAKMWNVQGTQLSLSDSSGQELARFEARDTSTMK